MESPLFSQRERRPQLVGPSSQAVNHRHAIPARFDGLMHSVQQLTATLAGGASVTASSFNGS